MKVCIVGGGVIGLHTAYYLLREGHEVTVIDKGQKDNNCSFGNAGYISPSHFIPLASPGIVAQGLKWMLSSTSPFYIKPRLDMSLIKWGLTFWSKANEKTIKYAAPHLNEILQYSRRLSIEIDQDLGGKTELKTDGCYMLYRKAGTEKHEKELAHEAAKYGIEVTMMSKTELQAAEPDVEVNCLGGAYYPIDCHLHPIHMMQAIQDYLISNGVQVIYGEEVVDFATQGGKVSHVITGKNKYYCDQVVIASGSWVPLVVKKLGIDMLLQPGKGYSMTFKDVPRNIRKPAILVDDRVAMTPLGNDLRVGGTMEISGYNHDINMNRIPPIVNAANGYFSNLNLQIPTQDKIWAGLRPCSPDGLPYIGTSKQYNNVHVGGGHAMIGISLAAGTGKIIADQISGRKTEVDISAYALDRF
jgi:D-amino-acid dehydrogenase